MVPWIEHRVKCQLRKLRRESDDIGLFQRCQIVLLAAKGRARKLIAEAVGCSVSWVDRVLKRFREEGTPGLVDHREDNGQLKLDNFFLGKLVELVDGTPQDHGWRRPSWTTELLCLVMERETGVRVHRATMSRALEMIGARKGRPKPVVGCPWGKRRRQRHLRQLRALVEGLGAGEEVVYVDEVDIDLNPRIGPDWMNRGTQKLVMTPGKNVKHYVAGALDARTRQITWVEGDHKNSLLVIGLLKKLARRYAGARVIHVILDNFKIHDSLATRMAVAAWEGKLVLHFLPPYCPDDNLIERTWKDLHDNVTRNHRCATMEELMREVRDYLRRRNRAPLTLERKAAA
jgi:transposase